MTSRDGMTAFVPDGDSRKNTATLLLGAALDAGLDDSRVVVAVPGGFYISDSLADAMEAEGFEAPDVVVSRNPEVDKAEAQLKAQRPSPGDPEAIVDNAVDVYDADDFHESETPSEVKPDEAEPKPEPAKKAAPKKAATKTSSGNRAEKQNSKEE